MADGHILKGPFDIPDVPDYIPRRLKPWLFVFFVVIIQFSGGLYLAAASEMVGTKALMQEDILMAGYASLVGMALNFTVMFRVKFRFSTRTQLLVSGIVLIAANMISAHTDSVPLLVGSCAVAGWFRMQATFACNSTIQLWLTPVRDMSVFFCFVIGLVDSSIQLSGMATVYTAFFSQWEYMNWTIIGLLALMMLLVMILVRPVRCPMYIPLLGIDWIGMFLWGGFMLCFCFVCVYGNFYDWWDAAEIRMATLLGIAFAVVNLWRATFLSHPYISFRAMTNRNVVRALLVYLVFFTIMSTEHVFEHSYAALILGFDETNLIDLNLYVLVGIAFGTFFTLFTFAQRKWRYKTMTAISFALAALYLAWFYFFIDYNIEKETLFVPLFLRGASSAILTIVFLTSIVQSGLPFLVFPQALTVNSFGSAIMGVTFGPALLGEIFRRTMASDAALLGVRIVDFNPAVGNVPVGQLYGMVRQQAMIVAMKEIYGWLLIVALASVLLVLLSYSAVRPFAIFPKWSSIRRAVRSLVRSVSRAAKVSERCAENGA